jgi:hypothetical protein
VSATHRNIPPKKNFFLPNNFIGLVLITANTRFAIPIIYAPLFGEIGN